jgi:hypothetical protein
MRKNNFEGVFMISDKFLKEVNVFLQFLDLNNFGYELKYDNQIEDKIINHYLPMAQKKSEDIKRECLEIMKKSCSENTDHGRLSVWKGMLNSIIWFCIIPTISFHEIEENQRKTYDSFKKNAISSVIRFSRWYHTDSGFWLRFGPYAIQIAKLLWNGSMEELNRYND